MTPLMITLSVLGTLLAVGIVVYFTEFDNSFDTQAHPYKRPEDDPKEQC